MTVLITTTVGAEKNYPDRDMFCRSFTAFIRSIGRQTNKDRILFVSGHERPRELPNESWIHFHSIGPADCSYSLLPMMLPKRPSESVVYEKKSFAGKNTDMGRKTYDGTIESGKWAYENGLKEYWQLRMDSDDLLWNGYVEFLHTLSQKTNAVWCRKIHLFDPRTNEVGVQSLPYSATCNAMRMKIKGDEILPDWYIHCSDHTTFESVCRQKGIIGIEASWLMCISTGTGNSISKIGRQGIKSEQWAKIIGGGKDIDERYGLDAYRGIQV